MTTLILRYADLGVATYASLRIVGEPDRTVTWVVEEPVLLAALEALDDALPEPLGSESVVEALQRSRTVGAFADPLSELTLAYRLGVLLIAAPAWQLLTDCIEDPRANLFVTPSPRLGRVPWGQLALPETIIDPLALLDARANAITVEGTHAARIPWPEVEITTLTEGFRLMELVEVALAVPANIATRHPEIDQPARVLPLLVLDPRVPGQRADAALGSVLGRPDAAAPLARHYAEVMAHQPVLPAVAEATALFRRTDADRRWLADLLRQRPSRLLFVGHASAADAAGDAEGAALHLACRAELPGYAEPIGEHRPLLVRDLLDLSEPIPPRVALIACASGSDYRFDEATGLMAAMVLGGAELVTASLWSLPTAAGYRSAASRSELDEDRLATTDPLAELTIAVDRAHQAPDPALALNRWQRAQLRRWREGDLSASPIYWAAIATFRLGPERVHREIA